MFFCEKECSFGLKSQCFTTKKGFIWNWKVSVLSWKKGSFWAEKSVFCRKRGGHFQTGEQGWVPLSPVSEGARLIVQCFFKWLWRYGYSLVIGKLALPPRVRYRSLRHVSQKKDKYYLPKNVGYWTEVHWLLCKQKPICVYNYQKSFIDNFKEDMNIGSSRLCRF